RVAVKGGSTGGFFTSLSLVRYPGKYKACVNFNGPVDMVRFQQYRENSYRRDVLRRVMGPDYNAPLFHERSAINFVDRMQAPLLILWGDRDYSVRPSQAEAMVEAMTKAGKSVDYRIYSGEDHGWYTWRPENVEHSLRLILEFYDRHLRGES
ncbi:MAG: prolyl oligopeptidase family serine peptidase, partial [Gemmatimonadetes bacterium]|nr:prolyl oligopeptidase family serine peptidase [Gemmatimonadota bacterium]